MISQFAVSFFYLFYRQELYREGRVKAGGVSENPGDLHRSFNVTTNQVVVTYIQRD